MKRLVTAILAASLLILPVYAQKKQEQKDESDRLTQELMRFSKPVEFYGPQYPEGAVYGEVDPRRTLYWNANVITDKEGNARVEFYNNSFSTRYTISGAGITASGIPYILNQNW